MLAFKNARRAGVPLIAIETSDPAQTIKSCLKTLNGKAEEVPVFEWTLVAGLTGKNAKAVSLFADPEDPTSPGINQQLTLNPTECLGTLVSQASKRDTPLATAVIFFHMANRLLDAPPIEGLGFVTGVWMCRDVFKATGITLVLMGPAITLPAELNQDFVLMSDPLPDPDEIQAIVTSTVDDCEVPAAKAQVDEKIVGMVDTLRGLSSFAIEQVTAMSIKKTGIDMTEMMRLKRGYISQLPGVEVREDKIVFDDIAGYDNVKSILRKKIAGKRPPRLVIWWDEFDRTIAGNAGDNTGVSQDQMAVLLQWAQDRLNEDRLSAAILVGVPGSAKSAITSAVHNEAKCECLRWDLGGVKDSLVGSSEKRIRNMLKVCDAMSGGHILILATANSLNGVPSPVVSRFALGTYFFDTPTKEEGLGIWKLKRKKYGISEDQPNPTADPLTGREIQQCCFIADDLKIPLSEAINYITPYHSTNPKELESLRSQAHNRWLSASNVGFYKKPSEQVAQGRRMSV